MKISATLKGVSISATKRSNVDQRNCEKVGA